MAVFDDPRFWLSVAEGINGISRFWLVVGFISLIVALKIWLGGKWEMVRFFVGWSFFVAAFGSGLAAAWFEDSLTISLKLAAQGGVFLAFGLLYVMIVAAMSESQGKPTTPEDEQASEETGRNG